MERTIRAAKRRQNLHRVRASCWMAAGAALAAGDASAAIIFSNSAGGNWDNANAWTPPGVPNNNEMDQYVARLLAGITTANLNNTTVIALTVDPTATLRFTPNTSFNVVAGPFANNGLAELTNGDFSSLILSVSSLTGTGALNITGNNAFFQLYTPQGNPLLIDSKQTVTVTGNNQLDLLTGLDLKGTLTATNSRIFVNGDVTLANTLNIGSGSIQRRGGRSSEPAGARPHSILRH